MPTHSPLPFPLTALLAITILSFHPAFPQSPDASPPSEHLIEILPAIPVPETPPTAPNFPPPQPLAAPSPLTPRKSPTIDDIARFIAGATFTQNSAYQAFEGSTTLDAHRTACKEMAQQWELIRLLKMRTWSAEEITPFTHQTKSLLYMFGGPDLIYANSIFPSIPEYVLAGLEPLGEIPEFFDFSEINLANYLIQIRYSLRSNMQRSFFQTTELRQDLGQKAVDGVFPILLYFAVLGGNEVLAANYITLQPDGTVAKLTTAKDARGIQLIIRSQFRANAQPQSVLYFKTDLSNDGLNSYPRFLKFLSQRGPSGAYAKAASYLMHQNSFSKIRDFLLSKSSFILQDESGIPFRFFQKGWQTQLYGSYVGPVEMFKTYTQADLVQAYQNYPVKPLNFGVGYRNNDSESVQIFSVRP